MTKDQFPISLQIRLDWSEMDLFGHINNVMYFKYIQASRVNLWEHAGLNKIFEKQNIGPILASTSCDFKKPLHYPGHITIKAGIEFIKTTSFGIHHKLFNEKNELAAEAHDVIVWYDFNSNSKLAIPEEIRERLRGEQ